MNETLWLLLALFGFAVVAQTLAHIFALRRSLSDLEEDVAESTQTIFESRRKNEWLEARVQDLLDVRLDLTVDVEHAAEQPRAKLHRQRSLCGFDRLTDAEATVVFKNLDRGDTAFQADHLTGQPIDPDKHPVADFQIRQIDAHCGAADTGDLAVHDWSLT